MTDAELLALCDAADGPGLTPLEAVEFVSEVRALVRRAQQAEARVAGIKNVLYREAWRLVHRDATPAEVAVSEWLYARADDIEAGRL